MADTNNEGKALDAVLRFIEARDNAPRNDGWSPDDPKEPDPDPLRRVDYVCTVKRLLYAFEHTRIEPFIDQIELGVQNQNLFDPIIERFDHRSDREFWELIVPVDASVGLTGRKVGKMQDALIKWIETLKTASERKSPKLAKWKRDSGARTVLVLEEDDLSLTNHFRVADALVQAEATTADTPDEVFMVSTCIEQTWWVVCLRGPGLVAGEPMPHNEFDPKELTKLTSR